METAERLRIQRRAIRRRHQLRQDPEGEFNARERIRSRTRKAVRMGKITKGVCWCGSTQVEAHHPDYTSHLLVIWFCRKHHLAHHAVLRELSVA